MAAVCVRVLWLQPSPTADTTFPGACPLCAAAAAAAVHLVVSCTASLLVTQEAEDELRSHGFSEGLFLVRNKGPGGVKFCLSIVFERKYAASMCLLETQRGETQRRDTETRHTDTETRQTHTHTHTHTRTRTLSRTTRSHPFISSACPCAAASAWCMFCLTGQLSTTPSLSTTSPTARCVCVCVRVCVRVFMCVCASTPPLWPLFLRSPSLHPTSFQHGMVPPPNRRPPHTHTSPDIAVLHAGGDGRGNSQTGRSLPVPASQAPPLALSATTFVAHHGQHHHPKKRIPSAFAPTDIHLPTPTHTHTQHAHTHAYV